jgi:hypothetical protein
MAYAIQMEKQQKMNETHEGHDTRRRQDSNLRPRRELISDVARQMKLIRVNRSNHFATAPVFGYGRRILQIVHIVQILLTAEFGRLELQLRNFKVDGQAPALLGSTSISTHPSGHKPDQ